MQSEEQQRFELDPELADFESALADTRLSADVANRDELMYRCGEAAISGDARRFEFAGKGRSRWITHHGWAIATAILVSFSLGAVVGHLGTDSDANGVASPERAATRGRDQPKARALASSWDPERIAVIHTGEFLYTSIDANQLNSLSTKLEKVGTTDSAVQAPSTLRAGAANRWMQQFDTATQ